MASVPNDYVYLDYAATAPLCEEAAEAMAPYQVPGRANLAVGGNANSLHGPGRAAFAALEEARRSIARDLGARRPDGIVFTSGATEADDAALLGIAQAAADERRRRGAGDFVPHVVVTAVEHDAVLAPAKRLESHWRRRSTPIRCSCRCRPPTAKSAASSPSPISPVSRTIMPRCSTPMPCRRWGKLA